MNEPVYYIYSGMLRGGAEFKTGITLFTRGIKKLVCEKEGFIDEVDECYERYIHKDWGLVSLKKNGKPYGVQNGTTIIGRYKTSIGNINIVTQHDRSCTVVMLPEEY